MSDYEKVKGWDYLINHINQNLQFEKQKGDSDNDDPE